MVVKIKARRLFLLLTSAAKNKKKVKDKAQELKNKKLDLISQELIVAEKILDAISKRKDSAVHVLVAMNRKILQLRVIVEEMKGKKEKIFYYF